VSTAVREAPHHNTLYCYSDFNCRRAACVERKLEWERNNRRRLREGRPALIDAEPVRRHVLQLQAENVTIYSIAAAAGVDQWTIRSLFPGPNRGRKNSVSPEIARKILAVTADHAMPGYTDGTGTRRRIQALIAIGWPVRRVGEQLGLNATYAGELIRRTEQGKPIYLATATKVAEAYETARHRSPEDCGVSTATANRKRDQAKVERWPTPRYWDEHPGDIDDPHFEPMYRVTRREIIAQDANLIMRTTGLDRHAAAARLGVDKSYVDHAFRDHPEYAIEVAA
jgi:hypothetical protein